MPPTVVLLVIAALVGAALVYGYRTVTALSVLRSLPSAATEGSLSAVDGEPVALTGEVVVEEPVETAEAAVEDADRSVGGYLWRSRFPDNTNSDLTIDDWGWERQNWQTFASGVEWGRFGVAADGRTVRIDPGWLREATDTEPLERLEVGGTMKPDRLSVSLWDSWYTYLRDRTEHRSLRRFVGHVRRHNDGIDLDRYLLEARPLSEGTTVSVSGVLRLEQGEPVVRGTDETPLLLSDQGFDGHRRWLRKQALWKGSLVAGLLVAAVGLWFEFYVPLGLLVAGLVGFLGYSFLQDVGGVLDWLRR